MMEMFLSPENGDFFLRVFLLINGKHLKSTRGTPIFTKNSVPFALIRLMPRQVSRY